MPEPIKLTACGDEPPQFASTPSQRHAASRALSALSVLIVDDNQDAAESMAMLVSMSGHVVQTAHTPADAILATDRDPPDVVVMDIGLPGIDGYQLAQKICERLTLRPLLVAITGHGNINDRSRQEGFDHHLLKPVDAVELLAILDARVQ